MSHDLHSDADAYALGALSKTESVQFESHLDSCVECMREVAELREMTAQLSQAVATAPPAALRMEILDQVAQTRQEPRAATVVAAPKSHDESARAEGSNVVPLSAARSRRAPALLAAAAVVAALGFGGWAWNSSQDAQREAEQAQLAASSSQQQAEQLTSLLAARDVKAVPGTFIHGGSGKVVYSRSAGVSMLLAADLPALNDDQVYEAWTIKGAPVKAGTFDANGQTALRLPDAALEAESVAVTVEPAGGSDQPTSDAVFSVTL